MLLNKALIALLPTLAVCTATRIVATDEVPLIGPSFSSNFDPSDSTAVRQAKAVFPGLIDDLFASKALNKTDLVFAIDVFSAATNASIYSYYHVGEGQNDTLTAGVLNDKTVSRLGSVSKLFTTYAILAQAGIEVFSHPVTRYLPELAGNSTGDYLHRIQWDEITVGALASHQAGTGGATDYFMKYVNDTSKFTPEEFLAFIRTKHPVMSSFRNAAYSDAGFATLGLVLERLSGLPYKDAIKKLLFDPLSLDDMTTIAPNGSDVNAINRLPIDNTSAWGLDIPITTPSGGIYASGADLRTAGLSILNSELLSAATTRAWMKPHSGTGSLVELVGAPWEITRLMIPVTPGSNRTRVSDLYTKAGGNGDYTAIIALSPDHGIGFSILVAGSTATPARWPIRDTIGETFIPAFEYAAAENAKKNFAGTFVNDALEGTNLTLSVDKNRPGLVLESFYIQGVESRAMLLGGAEPADVSARLYPTGPNSYSRSLTSLYKTKGTIRLAYRMIGAQYPLAPRAAVEGGKGGLFDNSFAWMNVGFFGTADEFILEIVDGRLVSVESTGAEMLGDGKMVLKRVD
ncbi:beta-lactamase/transpeptidase-like protein [Dactylonectria macrodidyma]|uniref:Beta-lactamase/transpeptidase-like protein n=1 Tax=Dactylonectria macrodidyma TaxID=307937 RepID=A0A9P9F665_9HYPO|nr:beta-lactamase/transpeptidase-like protein [Dactylonectria macrodidyma]